MLLRLRLVFGLLLTLCTLTAHALDLYVATNGNDTWTGAKTQPFATLEGARNAIRMLKQNNAFPRNGVNVWVRGGIYPRTSTFALTAADSGTASAPITYRAYPGETVRIIGGKLISGFTLVTDSGVLNVLDPSARGKVYQIDLKAQGITDYGNLSPRGTNRATIPSHLELFFGDKVMTLARWPNTGFTNIAGVPGIASGDTTTIAPMQNGFYYAGDRPKRWGDPTSVWVHGYWAYDWADSYENVASIDTTARLITMQPPYGTYGYRSGARIYFCNILEELDQPGEYFVDRRGGFLYFWPPSSLQGAEAAVSLLQTPLVSCDTVSYVTFNGLIFEFTRGNAIEISNGANVLVQGCTVRNIGNWAILVNGGTGHGISNSQIYALGDGGVVLNGGIRTTLTPGNHYVSRDQIHDIGLWCRCYQPAVYLQGVANRISNCTIYNGPHNAIILEGNDHQINNNEIYQFCWETMCVGAFYMGRDWTFRGNLLSGNYFHDIGLPGSFTQAVYLDDCSSGVTVSGNTFTNVQTAVVIGGGRDNTVNSNTFSHCVLAVDIDGRGLSPARFNMIYGVMQQELQDMNYLNPPFITRYPLLGNLAKYYQVQNGVPPEGNAITNNLVSNSGTFIQADNNATLTLINVHGNVVR